MPHQFVNRPRFHAPTRTGSSARKQFRWESANAILYMLGGVFFICGSILFFPAFEQDSNGGAWIFFAGSLLYLVVTGHDALEVTNYRQQLKGEPTIWDRLEMWAAACYLVGSLLFAAGSILFLSWVGRPEVAAWCFILGSLLFVLGATINVLQIVLASDMRTLQLMNLTALNFVTGSVLFAVASVPYLFEFNNTHDERTMDAFLAAQFLVGSVLFLAGGILSYRRAYLVVKDSLGAP
ncbi:MAG: hypothetical protein GKR86_15700 [Ilumatobacter sp.]|nr:hypothetical protein [Ilumatobacter sp.]